MNETTLRYITAAGMVVVLFVSSVRKPIQTCSKKFYITYYLNGKSILIDSAYYFSRTGLDYPEYNGKILKSDKIVIQLK